MDKNIRSLIDTEDDTNLLLASALLQSQEGKSEEESNNLVYGCSLRMLLRITTCYANYDEYFKIPKIQCKDGFSISIQISNGNYCSSENGYRQFGLNWETVEWGYPSQHHDLLQKSSQDSNVTQSIGCIDIDEIEEILYEHGGINFVKTFSEESLQRCNLI